MRTGRSGEDGALGGRGRRLNEPRGTLTPSRRGAREAWGNPPPGCGALWRMAQLGRCARATPRQPAGRVARGPADLGSESGLTERRTLPNRWAPECAFPSRRDRRMRFSVRVHAQNALFRKMRFSSPGQTRRLLTEKRILQPASHGKPHSATVVLPKSALCDTPLEVRSHGVRLFVRNGDTHPRHTQRLLTSQTHKAGHPSPHCHLILNVPVLHVHHRVAV